ncbi:MAG: T9SS type A sorting domain-containing protein [Saprospiraceae bacterium]|nr:T9SS type A sorting domain-containing protein [Saprospiraceae bacterium]
MKQLYSFFLLSILFQCAQAQACLPDSVVRDSAVGVYPKPVTLTNPNGGIKTPACIDKPYEFVFTVKISDTVSVPGIPIPIKLNNASIATTGAIAGLPVGITYACNPPNCLFDKNTIGCLILNGTATDANTPGIFRPVITLTLSTVLGPIEVMYPGQFFPGEYLLTLLDKDCTVSSKDVNTEKELWLPTVSQGWIYNIAQSNKWIQLLDVTGRPVYGNLSSANGVFDIPSQFSNGIYFVQWTNASGSISNQRIILTR